MQIAIVGPGAIGSTFALHLARAGHDVTVVARGARLAQLRETGAIVTTRGERQPVHVSDALDATVAWDLVLVTVLAHQVESLLPTLAASRAYTVMFMFNTVAPLGTLRDAVGATRFAFGFPSVLGTLTDGRLDSQVQRHGMLTTVSDARWAHFFGEAGIPSVVHDDMESWLRTHAALVVPFMIAVVTAHGRNAGLSWQESSRLAHGMREALALARRIGNAITPRAASVLGHLPERALAGVLWTVTRVPRLRRLGALGAGEPRALIDAMDALEPGAIPTLQAMRP